MPLIATTFICKNEDVSSVTKMSGFSAKEVQVCLTQGRNGIDL